MTYRSRPLLDLAKGAPCMAGIPNVCNCDASTVVSAHRNGGGMGTKTADWKIAWCCSACHDAIDGRTHGLSKASRDYYWSMAHARTMDAMWERGLIQVTGHTPREKAAQRLSKIVPRQVA